MKIILLFILWLLPLSSVYSDNSESRVLLWNKTETISEISIQIKQLGKNQTQESDNKRNFLETYRFNQYFKKRLSDDDKDTITLIADQYIKATETLEQELKKQLLFIQNQQTITQEEINGIENIKLEILEQKKLVYKDLTPFVDNDQYEEYLDFISQEVKNYKKTNDISSSLVIQKAKLDEKVTTIEEKIEANHKKLNQDITSLIEVRIDKKIKELAAHPKFLKLSSEWKIKVLDITLRKIKIIVKKIGKSL